MTDYIAGIDWGAKDDQSVAVLFELLNGVWIQRETVVLNDEQVARLKVIAPDGEAVVGYPPFNVPYTPDTH